MFGAFKNLFKKTQPAPAPARSSTSPASKPAAARSAGPASKVETPGRGSVSRSAAASIKPGDAITVPYSSIIKVIPQELWGKLAPAGVAGYNYTLSRKSVVEQLPHGAVKVNFGELRRNAPNGVFVNTSTEDGRMVDLPLSEILEQLHPDAITRRSDQTRKEVSDDVPDLFGAKGERLAPLRVIEKKELSTSTISRQKGGNTGTPTKNAPANAAPAAPIAAPPANPPAPIRMQPAAAPAAPAAPPKAPAAAPITAPKSATPAARALPKLPAAAPTQKPAAPALPTLNTGSFFIRLDAIAMNWPDGIRQELAQLKIPDAKVALPPVEICDGLKRGRIQYPWRTVRSWIQPTPIYATPSPHDDEMLELPLRTLTPLFLEFIRSNPVNRQAADAENITEFFRRAEQSSGASAEMLQPLFPASTGPASSTPAPASEESPAPAASAPDSAPDSSQPVIENNHFCLPVAVIAASSPEPVQHDIASFNLTASRIEIPLAMIEPGLKSGRIDFTWRELAGWLNPPSKPAQISINAEQHISLPLGLVAPLFMKSRSGAQTRRRTMVDQEIPDLFNANGKPLAPATAVAQNTAPSAPAPAEPAPAPSTAPSATAAAPAPRKVPTNLSELFNEPSKKTWTPNEIVQYSARLPKVAGTLIALQDGLLVAANMPPDLKTDTIAAFVPQIFGRMNQYTTELQMGETSAVSFNVEAGTFQVYNAGIIYFAAFARKGELLPLPELQLIAGELSRHTK